MNEMDNAPTSDEPEVDQIEEASTQSEPDETEIAETETEAVGPTVNPRLVVKRNNAETDEIVMVSPPAVIGRFDATVGPVDVDLSEIDESGYVSRKHAKITEEDGVYLIEDLGSSNGTFIKSDGEFAKIEEPTEIKSGDEIALGNARFVFYV